MQVTEQGTGYRIETEHEPTLNELVREYTLAVLKRYKGSHLRAAAALGIAFNTLYYRMRRYRAEKAKTP